MKRQNQLRLSVVIPCYNEEQYIGACLQALEAQKSYIDEIVVVDNNSTDDSISEISKFKDVILIRETKQGMIPARDAGVTIATGEIIARIDADTVVQDGWAKQIKYRFMVDGGLMAMSGTGVFYDGGFSNIWGKIRDVFAIFINKLVLRHYSLWGSNMAMRATCWQRVMPHSSGRRDIMEDVELAILVHDTYGSRSLLFDPKMRADVSSRRGGISVRHNFQFMSMWPRTLNLHGRTKGAALVWVLICVGFPFLGTFAYISARAYDRQKGRVSLRWLLSGASYFTERDLG